MAQLLTLTRSLIAAAPMALVLVAFGTGHVPVPWLLIGGGLGCLVYAITLRLVGELTSAEIVAGLRLIGERVRMPRRSA